MSGPEPAWDVAFLLAELAHGVGGEIAEPVLREISTSIVDGLRAAYDEGRAQANAVNVPNHLDGIVAGLQAMHPK